jgi:eukaryotic-like serine/threonine-protein kinase
MQMVPSDPYHGGGRTSLRTKQRHRTATTTNVSGAAAQAVPGKVAVVSQRRYDVRELLGRGGMSEVYRGFDLQLRRPVAIKRLRPDFVNNPAFRTRFRREAQSAGRLNHSAIVAIYDTGEERDATGASIPFIVMELVEGRSLRSVLRDTGRVPPWRALELTSRVLDALTCSHAAGIVHRDIKPANVMLTSTGAVKVADFGIARPVSDTAGTVTLAGTVVGTPQYLSPEQARGEAVDARSDIYSVGCMLYELLVGEPPFTGDSPVGIVVQHVSDAPSPPSATKGDVSTDTDSIVLKALAKDPSDRYQSASEMKADIEKVLSGQRPAATALLDAPTVWSSDSLGSPVARTQQFKANHVLAVMTLVLLVVVGASAFAVHRSSQTAAAAASTAEVPAVLGLGRLGAESVLRNANLVPRFEFVHGTEGATVGTVIKQIPARGAMAATDSTVVVMINIGSRRDSAAGSYDGEASRSPARSSNLRSSERFFAYADSWSSPGTQARRGNTSDGEAGTYRAHDGDATKKSDKGKKGQRFNSPHVRWRLHSPQAGR